MKKGILLVPLTAPALRAMMTYYLFRSYRIFRGAEAVGVKPPLCVQIFLNISTELKNQVPPDENLSGWNHYVGQFMNRY
jgi:hypothetical protein